MLKNRAVSVVSVVVLLGVVAPAAAQSQSLAEASEQAKQIKHEWPQSSFIGSTLLDPSLLPETPVVPPAAVIPVTPAASAPASPAKDEAYWKDRMRTLTTTRATDQTLLAAIVVREQTLDKQLHRSLDDILAIRDRREKAAVETLWQDAVTEVARLKVAVQTDTRAIADLELEAHRAKVPAGWLVIK